MPIETFLEKCREVIRLKHLSYRTEETYLPVIRRFIEFHGRRTHPKDMGAAEIRTYLSHLAVEQNVAASTQNVAFSALLFLYRDVLHIELPAIEQVERAQRPARLPEVFTQEEARAVLERMEGTPRLMAHPPAERRLRHSDCAGTAAEIRLPVNARNDSPSPGQTSGRSYHRQPCRFAHQ
jgi:site-specific recombinase XerD